MEFANRKKKSPQKARNGDDALRGEAESMMNAEYAERHEHPEEEEHVRYDAPELSQFKYEEQAMPTSCTVVLCLLCSRCPFAALTKG